MKVSEVIEDTRKIKFPDRNQYNFLVKKHVFGFESSLSSH